MLKEKYKCEYVLNSEAMGFHENLKELAKKLNANVAFDSVAGPLAG